MAQQHYSPWQTVAAMPDITVVFAKLTDDLGYWDPETRTITLDPRQTRAEMRSTLQHELEHVMRGDECIEHVSPVLAIRQELAASARAAARLIPWEHLAKALQWSQDEHELAEELHVDVDTVCVRLMTLTPAEHHAIDRALDSFEAADGEMGETA